MGRLDEMSPAGDHRTIWEEQCRTSGLSRAFSDGNREGAARGTSNPIDEIAPTSVVKIGTGCVVLTLVPAALALASAVSSASADLTLFRHIDAQAPSISNPPRSNPPEPPPTP